MDVSVVIPTCNRRDRVTSLIRDLRSSAHPLREILVVDSSNEKLRPQDIEGWSDLPIQYIESSVRSVCAQRNLGVRRATSPWVFLCDDDIEVPSDYLVLLADHIRAHPEAGAVSGLCLEKERGDWKASHPVTSPLGLAWAYLFQLGVWGEIQVHNPLLAPIVRRYARRGNHISLAGWPVLVDFSGAYFRTPIYALGASLVRRDWLLRSPYDEVLDAHGIGDNYGVAIGFPSEGIHVVTGASVRHHKEPTNRLREHESYARRLMALHYFIRSRRNELPHVHESMFVWSLMGQVAFHALKGNRSYTRAAWDTLWTVVSGKNPHLASHDALS